MTVKNVKVASSRWNTPQEFTTEATTWGELKAELGDQVLNFEGSPMKAVLRGADGTRNTLVDANTLLPEGDFAILLVPEKVKSGDSMVYNVATLKDMKTKITKMLDFMIDAAQRGGDIVFEEGDAAEAESVDVPTEEEVIDPLIQEARDLANE